MSQGPSVGSEVLPMEWAAGSLQKHHGCPVMHISGPGRHPDRGLCLFSSRWGALAEVTVDRGTPCKDNSAPEARATEANMSPHWPAGGVSVTVMVWQTLPTTTPPKVRSGAAIGLRRKPRSKVIIVLRRRLGEIARGQKPRHPPRTPQMHSSKEGKDVGVDASSELVHTAGVTSGNVQMPS